MSQNADTTNTTTTTQPQQRRAPPPPPKIRRPSRENILIPPNIPKNGTENNSTAQENRTPSPTIPVRPKISHSSPPVPNPSLQQTSSAPDLTTTTNNSDATTETTTTTTDQSVPAAPPGPPKLPPKPTPGVRKIPFGGLRKLPPRPAQRSASDGQQPVVKLALKKAAVKIVPSRILPKRPLPISPVVGDNNTPTSPNPTNNNNNNNQSSPAFGVIQPVITGVRATRHGSDPGYSRLSRPLPASGGDEAANANGGGLAGSNSQGGGGDDNSPTRGRPRSPSVAPGLVQDEFAKQYGGPQSSSAGDLSTSADISTATQGGSTFIGQIDLEALDLEAFYPTSKPEKHASDKSGKKFKIGSFASGLFGTIKGIKDDETGSGGSSSPAITTNAGATSNSNSASEVSDEELNKWPSVARTRRVWGPLDEVDVPQDVLKLINKSVLDVGFHIEFGDKTCPNVPTNLSIDHQEEYVLYYKNTIYPLEHSNWISFDETNELYIVVSFEEKAPNKSKKIRCLVRTRKDYTRLLLDANTDRIKALKAAMPDFANLKFTKVKTQEIADDLMKMEEKEVALGATYKFGVLYAKPGQTEDEIFANENPSQDFEEFLDFLGDRVKLLGWTKYKGGLDVKNQSTGEWSVYKEISGISIMFHVCTLLPAQALDVQRVERKRHIGNDVICIIFKEGDEPFVPTILTSQFIHICAIVTKVKGTGENGIPTKYNIAVSTKAGVEPHVPLVPHPAVVDKNEATRDWLLTKMINAERTAMLSPEFRTKMLRARKEFLKHLYTNYMPKKK